MSHALLEAWVRTLRRRGEAPAVTEAALGRVVSFRELNARARTWLDLHGGTAKGLHGRAAVFASPNGVAWFEVFLGLMYAGAVAVPLDPAEPEATQQALATELRAGFRWDGSRLVVLPAGARRFANPEVCLIKLTSGSTGRPRPLVFTAAQLLADARQIIATMGITERDTNCALIPFGHSYGLGNLTIPLIACGVPIIVASSALPQAVAAEFARWRPSVLPGVPAVFRGLAMSDIAPAAMASLRLAVSAGAPLPPEVAQAFAARYGRRIHSFYGSSETGGISYDRAGAATLAGRSVGQAMRGVRLTALPGERLRVCSPSVFTYRNRRRAFGLGCWTPADQAVLRPNGEVVLFGRRGLMVKIAGRRVNLAEVAARLRRIPGVRDVWVGVGPGAEPALGAALATCLKREDIRTALRADTAAWKIPRHWLLLGDFPLTARGKTDTEALRQGVFG
jgi:acyl-CoA synthetase (AMP-forming)/AMP-acid ligase II